MDWAVQAARRKTQRLPGSSRSIIETLNVFNRATEEGHGRIDVAVRETSGWLNNEVLAVRADGGKLARGEDERSVMVSPEKTATSLELDQVVEESGEVPASGTPLRAAQEAPSATPKSLADDNYTEEAKARDPAVLKAANVKASPWSPYKRAAATEDASAPSSRTENSRATDRWGLTEEVRTSTASDSNVTAKSLEQIVRDRSQRRSNMFVPLPSRDPLVVQQAAPKAAIAAASPTGPSPARATVERRPPTLHPKNGSVLSHKKTTGRMTQSPTYSSTSTRISRATSSVFDRLSSLPTKSFENKVASKLAGRRVSASSSIDVTGSPIKRTSPVVKNSGTTETTIHDTLKNIFFAKDKPSDLVPRLGNESSTISRPRQAQAARVGKSGDARVSSHSRNVKITRHQVLQSEASRGLQANKSGHRTLPKVDLTERKALPLKLGAVQGNTVSDPRSPISKSSDRSAREAGSNLQQVATLGEAQKTHIQSPRNRSKHQDRLTKFQLIPPAESEKDDLKEKLNKRLSEVMRTQLNQNHRRRIDQQKRKSQLDEDFKRRTRLWNEMKETSFSLSTGIHRNSNIIPTQANTVLHDLNIVDHRTVIGEEAESRDPTAGNQTLPEIQSDSEDDGDFTLASWAKSPYLEEQLHRQQNWDPKEIFGPLPPLHIDQIFPNTRTNKLKPLQASTKKI